MRVFVPAGVYLDLDEALEEHERAPAQVPGATGTLSISDPRIPGRASNDHPFLQQQQAKKHAKYSICVASKYCARHQDRIFLDSNTKDLKAP